MSDTGGISPDRRLLLLGCVASLLASSLPACAAPRQQWQLFQQNFMDGSGRIRDPENGGASHSEGQGYGLIMAAAFQDRPTFEAIWNWTRQNLGRRDDGLFAWHWLPPPADPATLDPNNASDGDLLIAWGLARGARQWQDEQLSAQARSLAGTILDRLLRPWGELALLIPGMAGFDKPEGLILNPSYWVYPAFRDLAVILPDARWAALRRGGHALLELCRFGIYALPADWVAFAPERLGGPHPDFGQPTPAPGFPALFGYDAIRIALYLAWDGAESLELAGPMLDFWLKSAGRVPATLDLATGQPGPHPASAGLLAVADVSARLFGHPSAVLPPPRSAHDSYYSSALFLLSQIALDNSHENRPQ
jgi:endoglucanase